MTQKATREKRDYHHGSLKQALLEETAKILREQGESALSLRRLASNLNVSRTAPYNHFKNKEALLCAVAEEGFKRFDRAMNAVRRKHQYSSGKELSRALVQAYLRFARNNQEYYDLMYSRSSWRGEEKSASLVGTARKVLLDDIERLKRAQDLGLIKQDVDVAQYTRIYWGTLHGISRLSIDGVYTNSASLKKFCNATADMLWQQLDPS